MTNIEDSYEYHAECAKVNFQNNLTALLELTHTMDAYQRSEILRITINLGAAYDTVNNTNRLLNANYNSVKHIIESEYRSGLKKSIQDFKEGKITKDELGLQVKNFIHTSKRAA